MNYDVIVIGLGAMGSATLYQLSKFKDKKILGIDQFLPPHTFGSSHGESRITRLAIAEGDEYVALVQRSHAIWKEIEKEYVNDGSLYIATSGLIIDSALSNHNGSFLERTQQAAKKHRIQHVNLNADTLLKEYGQLLNLSGSESAYKETAMGYLRPETCIKVQLSLAKKRGANIHTQEKAVKYERLANGHLRVITDQTVYETKQIIVAAGSWLPQLLHHDLVSSLKIYRQTMYWFQVEEDFLNYYKPDKFPVIVWQLKNDMLLIFPIIDTKNSIKVVCENYSNPTTPQEVNRIISDEEKKNIYVNYIKPHLKGITDHCVKAEVCLYTCAPHQRFMIDYAPGYNNRVIVASPCSGHGFKHSAAIGESLANITMTNESKINVIDLFGGINKK